MVAEKRIDAGTPVQLQVAQVRHDPRVERTRRRVLAAIRHLLAEGGLEATTVNAVADRAGVHKTTVYRNWSDPHDLVHEALSTMTFDAPLPDSGDVRRDLVAMFDGLARSLQSAPWDCLLPSIIGAAIHDNAIRQFHGELTRRRRDAAATVIQRAVERGALPVGTDPVVVIEAIVGPLYYRLLMTREPVGRSDVVDLVGRALRALRTTHVNSTG